MTPRQLKWLATAAVLIVAAILSPLAIAQTQEVTVAPGATYRIWMYEGCPEAVLPGSDAPVAHQDVWTAQERSVTIPTCLRLLWPPERLEPDDPITMDPPEMRCESPDQPSLSLVDVLISDMAELNDGPLRNHQSFGWAVPDRPGINVAGTEFEGDYLLANWVVAEAEDNWSNNVDVEFRNGRVDVLIGDRWIQTHKWEKKSGAYYLQNGNYADDRQGEFEDCESVPMLPNLNAHGWWGGRQKVGKVDAITVRLEARLVGPDAATAKYMAVIGADPYEKANGPAPRRIPAIGLSRAKLLTDQWQTFSMTTLTDVGDQEPGAGITTDGLRLNPPPN